MLSTIVSLLAAASTFQPVVTQRISAPDTAEPRLELGVLSEPLEGELSAAVRSWALREGARYGLPATSTLRTTDSFGTRFGASFHLVQEVAGVEVSGGKLVVTVDERARVVQVSSSLVRYARVVAEWSMSGDEALRRAAAAVPLPVLRRDASGLPLGGSKRTLFTVGDALHAGYLVHVPTLDLTKNWYLAIDAVTGELLGTQNRVYHAALDAQVYPVSPGGLDAGVGRTPTVTRTLTHADGGSMIADTCEAPLPDGGLLTTPNDGGHLCGTQLITYNCCPSAGCAPDAGPARADGGTTVQNVPVFYDVAVCDRFRRATNNTTLRPGSAGTYEYPPADPPTNRTAVEASDPANSDEFAEVHAFYHVNRVYDWVRGLSAAATPIFAGQQAIRPFTMRDERRTPARRVAVWVNVMFPNFQELMSGGFGCILTPPCRANSLVRLDNAAFMPVEQFEQLPLPEFETGVDTLMIFQGNSADAAYDATVIQHEFGHGVVTSTANLSFDSIATDQRSANNETGAMHEGFADYIAGAFNNLAEVGPYFGPRAAAGAGVPGVSQDGYLRTLDNTLACPEVLWGEVHQDGQHLAAALWQARNGPFAGGDQGATFDAAFYAMLVSLSPTADFAEAAATMADKASRAFPGNSTARAQMTDIFTSRGVIGCSKVIDVTGAARPRPYYGIPTASTALRNALIPGPYQLKLRTPNGAVKVRVSARVGGGANPLAPAPGAITTLVRAGQPITFTRSATNLLHDAEKQVSTAPANGSLSAVVDVDVPCGASQEVYVSLANTGGGAVLQQVAVTFEPRPSCTPPDAGSGTPDGGGGETTTVPLVGAGGLVSQPPAKTGCGCASVELAPLLGLAGLTLLRRRRR